MVSDEYECEETLLGKISCIMSTILMAGVIIIVVIILAFTEFFTVGEADKMVDAAFGLTMLAYVFSIVCMVGCRKKERVKYVPY